jgi:hypothetical protein
LGIALYFTGQQIIHVRSLQFGYYGVLLDGLGGTALSIFPGC